MKYIVTINDKSYEVEVEKGAAEVLHVTTAVPPPAHAHAAVASAAPAVPAAPAPSEKPVSGEVVAAPMPGIIVNILKNPGDPVKRGDTLLTMEAMKMENEIAAPRDGVVAQILTSKGSTVSTGTPLVVLQ